MNKILQTISIVCMALGVMILYTVQHVRINELEETQAGLIEALIVQGKAMRYLHRDMTERTQGGEQ